MNCPCVDWPLLVVQWSFAVGCAAGAVATVTATALYIWEHLR